MFTAEAGLSGASLNFFKIIFSLSGVTRGFFRACIRLHGSPLLDAGGTGVPSKLVLLCRIEAGKGMRRPNHCIGGEIRATYRIPAGLCSSRDLVARGLVALGLKMRMRG